jgi:hypothetical protein
MTQKLGRRCTICSHDRHRDIDAAIVRHATGYLKIACEYGVVLASVQRHAQNHLREQLRAHRETEMLLSAESLLSELNRLHGYASRALDAAEAEGDHRTVLAAVDVAAKNVERLAKLGALGEIEQRLAALEHPEGKDERP